MHRLAQVRLCHGAGSVSSHLSGYVAFTGYKEVGLNSVVLTGNLATDVEVKDLGDDRQVANFLLAVDRIGSEEADFFRVSAWNKQAELCGRYLTKGRRIGIDGRLKSSSWEDSDGNKRSAVEVVARHVEFLSPPSDGDASRTEVPFETAAA
jgi:single-strand DNA-binding protein